MRKLFIGYIAICFALFAAWQAHAQLVGEGVWKSVKNSSTPPTYTPGANVAVQNVAFSSPIVTFTGMNGGTNYPSGATVLGFFEQDETGYTIVSVVLGGQAATQVSGATDSSNKCTLWQATMPATELDTAVITYSSAPQYAGAAGGYFLNLVSSTATSAGNETYGGVNTGSPGNGPDPQGLNNPTLPTVPSSGFGVVMVALAVNTASAPPTALSWTNTSSGSGDTFAAYSGVKNAIGLAHTITPGSWNPAVSGVTNTLSFNACMSAATYH